MHIRIRLALIALTLLALAPSPGYAPARQGSSGEVFALINDYRAANGLPAFTQNNILMQTAQGQSDYQASIQQVTHGGPGGSRPRDRAYAAGYGDGQVIFVSELITGGFEQDSQGALTWWKNSPEHNSYLLSPNYFELGIGVATDGDGRYYYTAVMGNIATGTTYVPEQNEGEAVSAAPNVEAQPVMIPVIKEEPRANGALVHIVRTGQALWTIAAVYEVDLNRLYELNNLNAASFIFPGDEIIVEPPGTFPVSDETQADEPSATPTQEPATPTASPSATPVVAGQQPAGGDASNDDQLAAAAQSNTANNAQGQQNSSVQLVVGVALVSILGVIVASFFIQRPQTEPDSNENDPFAPIT